MKNKAWFSTIVYLLTFVMVLSFTRHSYSYFIVFGEEPNAGLTQEDLIEGDIDSNTPVELENEGSIPETGTIYEATALELPNMSMFNMDNIISQQDIIDAIAYANPGDELVLIINGNIPFNEPILINKSLSIIMRGNGTLTTTGAFRHFSTGYSSDDGTKIPDVSITVERGVVLDGGSQGGGIHLYELIVHSL